MLPPIILSIAGSDCSGGAGIQADIKTISALGGYAASVITAVTAQNTLGVQSVYPIPVDMVKAQITSVMDDLRPDAVKIGMVHDAGIVTTIVDCLQTYTPECIVYDPVMISTSGRRLMTEETIQVIKTELFPLCRYNTAILVKGGHLEDNDMCDVLYCRQPSAGADVLPSGCILYSNPKIESRNLHGTGCTLSSAIATFLAGGNKLDEAVCKAKEYIGTAINRGKDMNIGHGNGPLWHFPLSE